VDTNGWMILWTGIMAVATAGVVVVSAIYTYFTRALVRGQIDPKVIVYVRHDRERRSILTINIENIGRDIAYDLEFHPSRPVPESAFGIELASAALAGAMTSGPLISGIPSLGPGDSRVITWGQYGGLTKSLDHQPIVLKFEYKTADGRRMRSQAILEVESHLGTDASSPPAVESARSLAGIEKSMKHMARSLSDLRSEIAEMKNDRTEAKVPEG
jgi:hypothetical protein